jgi:hypothetical protein
MRDLTHFEAPLGVCREQFGDKSPNCLILGAKPRTLLEAGFGVDAFVEAGFRALVLSGEADAQVEDGGFDLNSRPRRGSR